ncbi:MAG: hypothetical protein ACPLPS_06750 [bacterium]
MEWKFIILGLVGLFGISYSLIASKGKEKPPPLPLSHYLKALAFALPLLFIFYLFLKPPFPFTQNSTQTGYFVGILLGGLAGLAFPSFLRLPSSTTPSPRLLAISSLLLFSATILYLLPYDLSFLSFGFALSFALFLALWASLLNSKYQDDIFLSANLSLILFLALIFGVYHRDMSQKKLPEEIWFLLPLSFFAISLLSFFLPTSKSFLSLIQTSLFYLIFTFTLTFFYLHYLVPFYVAGSGGVTGGIFLSLYLSEKSKRMTYLPTLSILLLLGLLALSFRFLRAYGICLSALSLSPFLHFIFSQDEGTLKRNFNLFLFPISSLAIFRLSYQFFFSLKYTFPPSTFSPTLYDFYPLIGLLAGALVVLLIANQKQSPSSHLLLFLLSMLVFSFLASIYGLYTAIGFLSGALLASFLLFLFPKEFAPSTLSIFFLLTALLLIPKLSTFSVLKRIYKFYITLGAIPISLFIIYLLSLRRDGEK